MSATQTSVADKAVAFPGMRANAEDDSVVRSYVNAEASAQIPFGYMVVQGTNDNDAKIPTGSSSFLNLLGLVTHSHDYARTFTLPDGTTAGELGATGLLPGVDLSVMTEGELWVTTETAVAPNDKVYLRIGGTGTPGLLGHTSDSTNTLDCSAFMRWTSSVGSAGLAKVAFDMKARNSTSR